MSKKVAIIGGGLFGVSIADNLHKQGDVPVIYEREPELLTGATTNNFARIHQGFHYPRCRATIKECNDAFDAFAEYVKPALQDDLPIYYAICNENSFVSYDEYTTVFDSFDITYIPDSWAPITLNGMEGCIKCFERYYDQEKIVPVLKDKIDNVDILLNYKIESIQETDNHILIDGEQFDAAINCTWSNINDVVKLANYIPTVYEYRHTVEFIVQCDIPRHSTTVMDGNFFCITPYNDDGLYILSHVVYGNLETYISTFRRSLNYNRELINHIFQKCIYHISEFAPELATAKMVDIMPSSKIIDTSIYDARPSRT